MIDVYLTTNGYEEITGGCWTYGNAQKVAKEDGGDVTSIYIEPLSNLVERYFKARGYQTPTAEQAFLFLTSEVGELADALVQAQSDDWVRNNERERKIEGEIGDVLMMLVVTAKRLGIDPIEAMLNKFKEKGYGSDDL